jgi:hypothetical protein
MMIERHDGMKSFENRKLPLSFAITSLPPSSTRSLPFVFSSYHTCLIPNGSIAVILWSSIALERIRTIYFLSPPTNI